MSEENLNYEEYAKSLSEQALELMPEYISADDKQYIFFVRCHIQDASLP